MQIDRNYASTLSRLFSSAVLKALGKNSKSPLLARLLDQTQLVATLPENATVGDAFDKAFRLLHSSKYRDDYVYRTALTQKVLLGRYSLNTATLLNEFRTGGSRADMAILNGTSTAYEIKSDRDTLTRLPSQIRNYQRVFASVTVITGSGHIDNIFRLIPEEVGVTLLSDRFTLRTIRPPTSRPDRTDPSAILESIRVSEAQEILAEQGIEVPPVPNTQLRTELHRIFVDLDPLVVHDGMVKVLRKNRSQAGLAHSLPLMPISLQTAVLTLRPTAVDASRIRQATNTPLAEALAWK